MLKASTINPRTIFTEFIHPPDFGSLFSHEGNMANRVNGMENPSEKNSMPSTGRTAAPDAPSMRSAPTIGPTHERLTMTVVSAKKNEPI